MCIHIEPVDFAATTFPKTGPWDLASVSSRHRSQLDVLSIGVPVGKHDVSLCPTYEHLWRGIASKVIAELSCDNRETCFVWAAGPVEANGLPYVFRHLAGNNLPRYHIEGVTHLQKGSYRHSWLSFEFFNDTFEELMTDADIDLEHTRLYLLWFQERWLRELITKAYDTIGLSWVLENYALALAFHRHFEGCYVAGMHDRLASSVKRLGRFTSGQEKESKGTF